MNRIWRRATKMAAVPLGAVAAMLWPTSAEAACGPLAGCSCTATATGVAFGGYDPLAVGARDMTGTINVRCTLLLALGGSFVVDLSTGSAGSYGPRTLKNGASTLNYNLYSDAAHSVVWGNGTGGSTSVTRVFSALLVVDETLTVYGRIPARQNVAAGAYADTIIVTITY